MVAVPIKPEYGPTLGRLLSPSWRAASPLARGAVAASAVGFLVLILASVLTLENAKFSHGGKVPFSFSYRSLYRVGPDPGGYVKIQRRSRDGRLEDSLAVEPLQLPPYAGALSGELPLFAEGYIRGIRTRYAKFALRGEGKTKVNTVPAYSVMYTTVVEGRRMYGRDILLLPARPRAREGVQIVMLTSPTANAQVTSPLTVATTGILLRPLRTFTFG
jgi:hypothetical protein